MQQGISDAFGKSFKLWIGLGIVELSYQLFDRQ